MQDHWQAAADAFEVGSREAAKAHLTSALSETPQAATLQRTILQVNHHAVVTYTNPAPPPPLPQTSSANPSIRLLAEEAYLTAAHNATLRALRDNPRSELTHLRDALRRVLPAAKFLLDSGEKRNAAFGDADGPYDAAEVAVDALIRNSELIPPNLRSPVRRWADAAATSYELLFSGLLLQQTTKPSLIAIAKSLRSLINTLSAEDTPEQARKYDEYTARTNYLSNLPLSNTALNNPDIAARTQGPDEELHLPLAYLHGARLLRACDPSARRLLEVCASRSYRLADSLCLLARLESGNEALQAWQRAFAVDVRRPNGLWLAATEFGTVGRYAQQATILGCLEELLETDVGERRGVKIDVDIGIMEDDNVGVDVVTKSAVCAERARALMGTGEWKKARELLGSITDETSTRADVLRDRALCAVCDGDIQDGMTLSETAKAAAAGPTDCAGVLLVEAEALLRMEKVEEARDKLLQAFREARLGDIGVSWDAEAPRLLRGVCFHNLAVLHYCLDENAAADECFAAAETAFRKCEIKFQGVAERLGVLSAYGRSLVMWGRGMVEDAAEYWRVRRGLNTEDMDEDGDDDREDTRPESHVVSDVSEETLERFDHICLDVCRKVEKRKETERLLKDVEKEWPLKQRRMQP